MDIGLIGLLFVRFLSYFDLGSLLSILHLPLSI